MEDKPFKEFSNELLQTIKGKDIQKLIIDLRDNKDAEILLC